MTDPYSQLMVVPKLFPHFVYLHNIANIFSFLRWRGGGCQGSDFSVGKWRAPSREAGTLRGHSDAEEGMRRRAPGAGDTAAHVAVPLFRKVPCPLIVVASFHSLGP